MLGVLTRVALSSLLLPLHLAPGPGHGAQAAGTRIGWELDELAELLRWLLRFQTPFVHPLMRDQLSAPGWMSATRTRDQTAQQAKSQPLGGESVERMKRIVRRTSQRGLSFPGKDATALPLSQEVPTTVQTHGTVWLLTGFLLLCQDLGSNPVFDT